MSHIIHKQKFRPRWMARQAPLSWSINLNRLCQASRVLSSKHFFNKYVTLEEITRGKAFGN